MNDAPPVSDPRINELIYTCLPSVKVHPDQLMIAWCEILRDTQNALQELRALRFEHQSVLLANEMLIERDAAKQARIDALMFEFCPDEMTDELRNEWARHQGRVENPMT